MTTTTDELTDDTLTSYDAGEVEWANGSAIATPLSLAFSSGQNNPTSIAIDETNQLAYVICRTSPGLLLKFNVSGAGAPTFVSSLTLSRNNPEGLAFDRLTGYVYVISDESPARVIKVNGSTMAEIGVLALNSGEGSFAGAFAIDETIGIGIIGCSGSGEFRIVKIALGAGAALPTRLAVLEITGSSIGAPSEVTNHCVRDRSGRFFLGTSQVSSNGLLIKINAQGSSATAPTLIGYDNTINAGDLQQIAVDDDRGLVWVRTGQGGQRIERFSQGTPSTGPASIDSLTVNASGSTFSRALAYNAAGSSAILGDGTTIRLAALRPLSSRPMLLLSSVSSSPIDRLYRGAFDVSTGYSYFVSRDTPGTIVKVRQSFSGSIKLRSGVSSGSVFCKIQDTSSWGALWQIKPTCQDAIGYRHLFLASFDNETFNRYVGGTWFKTDTSLIASTGISQLDLERVRTFPEIADNEIRVLVLMIRVGVNTGSFDSLVYNYGDTPISLSAEAPAGPYDALPNAPDYPLDFRVDRPVEGVVFEGGYQQRFHVATRFRLSFQASWGALDLTDKNSIVSFLLAHIEEPFAWTIPVESSSRNWRVISDPAVSVIGLGVYSVTCQVEEVLL